MGGHTCGAHHTLMCSEAWLRGFGTSSDLMVQSHVHIMQSRMGYVMLQPQLLLVSNFIRSISMHCTTVGMATWHEAATQMITGGAKHRWPLGRNVQQFDRQVPCDVGMAVNQCIQRNEKESYMSNKPDVDNHVTSVVRRFAH